MIEKKDGPNQTIFYHDEYTFPSDPADVVPNDIALVRIEPLEPSVLETDIVTPICFESAKQHPYLDCDSITVSMLINQVDDVMSNITT